MTDMPESLALFEDMEDLPDKVRGKVALIDGELHISGDLKGDLDMANLVHRLRRRGVLRYAFHKPSEFSEKYAQRAVRCARGQNEIQQLAIDLIARAYARGASDIHIVDTGAYTRIKFRILGDLCEDTQMDPETGRLMISAIYGTLGQSADSPSFTPSERQDGRIVNRDYLPEGVHSVRIHTEPIECAQAENGTGTFMALRLLYDATSAKGSLEERMAALGFTPKQAETMSALTKRDGLKIISGPTGHGKTTALKHIMEAQTERTPTRAYHSVEDPPEVQMRDVNQSKVTTKQQQDYADRGRRASEYTNAIAGVMRSDSDVMMIGEIRYPEAAVSAIEAALTGQSVWATLHANNAFGIVTRMAGLLKSAGRTTPLHDLCDPNVLAGLEYQRLISKLCPHCKKAWRELSEEERAAAMPDDVYTRLTTVLDVDVVEGLGKHEGIFVRGEGCDACKGFGFIGQTVAAEVIDMDPTLLKLLRDEQMLEARHYWRNTLHGMTYIEHALEGILAGLLDPVKTEERLGVPLTFNTFFDLAGTEGKQ